MVAHVTTVAFIGIEARPVDVQVQIAAGLPAFMIVGLPDKAVAESKERVRAALNAVGLALPPKRITINLAPADLPKEGSHYDLPIAVGLLVAMGVVPQDAVADHVVLGELGLDGAVQTVPGVLPAAMAAMAMTKGLVCPMVSGGEAAWAGDLDIIATPSLIAFANHVKGTQVLRRPEARPVEDHGLMVPDLRDIKGQEAAKRALEVAAAGGHNLLMIGPPGAGKSMLAARLPGILPNLDPSEALEVSMVASLAGALPDGRISLRRPYRNPHHSASMAALVGGGARAKPGEVSLAHRGVLFLDELPEFSRQALDSLRQPLETGEAVVARAEAHVSYPARVQLIAAMNPCRCGHLSDAALACARAPKCAGDYQARLSGPLLDRIDIHIDVPPVSAADLNLPPPSEGSAAVALRVDAARAIQRDRYQSSGVRCNAEADGDLLMRVANPDDSGQSLMRDAVDKLKLTARGYHRILRVARTLADLTASDVVRRQHVAEALSYRRLLHR